MKWVDGEVLEDIKYADDVVLGRVDNKQEKMTRFARKVKEVGSKVNTRRQKHSD